MESHFRYHGDRKKILTQINLRVLIINLLSQPNEAFFQIFWSLRSQKRLNTHNSVINRDSERKNCDPQRI